MTIGLTRTALLAGSADPEYADYWCELLALSDEQLDVLRFYTALFSVDLMSEFGQPFNRAVPQDQPERLERLKEILNDHL